MKLRYLSQVTTLSYDQTKCRGCGRCTEVCPHQVFSLVDGIAVLRDKDACIECGACRRNCAFGAIHVRAGVGCASAILSSKKKNKSPSSGGCSC